MYLCVWMYVCVVKQNGIYKTLLAIVKNKQTNIKYLGIFKEMWLT